MTEPIQSLELRRLLTTTLSTTGILSITGTAGNDAVVLVSKRVIEIKATGALVPTTHIDVMMNGVSQGDFSVNKFSKIRVSLLDGNDSFFAGTSNGRKFRCTVAGGEGDDTISGGPRPDRLDGGPGDDSIVGNNGSDFMISYAGSDTLLGGKGNDTADYSARAADVTLSMDNAANDGATGETGNLASDIETVIGGAGNDFITAAHVPINVTIDGRNGHNTLVGGDGDDFIIGGAHADTLRGGPGDDTLQGHAGRDKFYGDEGFNIFLSGDDNERDTLYSSQSGFDDSSGRDFLDLMREVP